MQPEVNPFFQSVKKIAPVDVEILISVEGDEFWSHVGKKKKQSWTWCALERETGIIIARHNGKRTDESCSRLMEKLSEFSDKVLPYRQLSELQQIYSGEKTYHRER